VSAFADLAAIGPQQIWDGVRARVVRGERVTFAVIELEADSLVPEHRHQNEQLGVLLSGSARFRIGDETRELGPGATWSIPGDTPHEVQVGRDGAVVAEVFAPSREDWDAIPQGGPTRPRWPD
jgi:quercetin dioxygenase-like cupin family protein